MNESRSIEDYLDELRREFPWGRRFKGRVLPEVEDHLREGVRHERAGNVPSPEAERRVIERFGSPRLVARRFAEDLTGGGARAAARVIILVVVGVMDLRLVPSPALGELLGIPANGFFEPPVRRGRATLCRHICVRPWTWRNSRSWWPSPRTSSSSGTSGATVGARGFHAANSRSWFRQRSWR